MTVTLSRLTYEVEKLLSARRIQAASVAKRDEPHMKVDLASNSILVTDGDTVVCDYQCHDNDVINQFHNGRRKAHTRLIMGPRGSSKSSACCSEIILTLLDSDPCSDGVRRYRCLVARNTYRELMTTTIRTFAHWFGHECLGYNAKKAPPECTLSFMGADGIRCEIEVLFVSFDRPQAAKKALSLELTGAYFNESSEISSEVLHAISGSISRYPEQSLKDESKYYWSGIILDSNAFADYHPIYERFVRNLAPGHQFYRQPGGMTEYGMRQFKLNSCRENKRGLSIDYYDIMSQGKPLSFIRSQICNQFTSWEAGKPCHPDYITDLHSVDSSVVDVSSGLWLGWDYGGTNACLIAQKVGSRLICLQELSSETMSLTTFAQYVGETLVAQFPDMQVLQSVGDPSNNMSIETRSTSTEIIQRVINIKTVGARSNNITRRLAAVDKMLAARVTGKLGQLVISRKLCPLLHAGLAGKYQFSKVTINGADHTREQPIKDQYSHLCDALQYLCLTFNSLINVGASEKDRDLLRSITSPRIQ